MIAIRAMMILASVAILCLSAAAVTWGGFDVIVGVALAVFALAVAG